MKQLVERAIDVARRAGADYADARLVESEREELSTRNGAVATLERRHSLGIGIRVLSGGAWGFAATSRLDADAVARTARAAVEVAAASGRSRACPVALAAEPAHVDRWATTVLVDPFQVPIPEKIDLLQRVDAVLRRRPEIAVAETGLSCLRTRTWMGSTEGTFLDQTVVRTGVGLQATAVAPGEVQIRSYPCSGGGQFMTAGFELVRSLALEENAERVREEAVALLTAPPCPETTTDLILESSQIALQIHESCAHATELDRVLGMEESLAGRSFLLPEHKGRFRYGSDQVNLVADQTVPGGLATCGYDDDGVRAQRFHVVRDGVLTAFSTTREVAHAVGEERSRGCARAEGFHSVPILRIPNLSLVPGDWQLARLVADTEDGIYMATNRSWSIDQMRLNFDFACEAAWEIRQGKLGRMLRNPTYSGITPEFWGSCDAVCDQAHFTLWGVPNCGKGEPMQVAGMSHGASPARFRRVRVGGRR